MNLGYPQQFYPQPQYQKANSINWVQGIEGAKAFQLMPNTNVVLLDSENDKFYIKSCDNVGMCTLRTFNYIEEITKPREDYVTREELEEVIKKYEQIISGINKGNASKSVQQSPNTTGDGINKK